MSPEKKRKQPKIAWRELGNPGAGDRGPGPDTGQPGPDVRDSGQDVPVPSAERAPAVVAAPVVAPMPAPSPLAIAAGLNAAPVAAPAPTPARVPRANPSPSPDSPTPEPLGPEAEVHRILARLASNRASAPRPVIAPIVEPEGDVAVPRRGPAIAEEEIVPAVSPAMLRDAARARRGRAELLLFRIGREIFALPLGAVEEAIESPDLHPLPEMPAAMLGVFRLRERLVPTYSPAGALGVTLASPVGASLMTRAGERRIALAVDDVEDVMELDLATLREPPVVDEVDGVLLGVARFGRELVGVLDPEALISACLGGRTLETT